MKKQNIKFLLALLVSMLGSEASAHDVSVKYADGQIFYYNYINNNTELEVTYRGTYRTQYDDEYTGNVVIPESYRTTDGKVYPVTRIGEGAFYDCAKLNSITIPKTVTSIGGYAFYGCSNLTNFTIYNSSPIVDDHAFYNFTGVVTTIEFHCKEISNWFPGSSTLKKVIIGEEVETIKGYPFGSSLTEVHISDLAAWCNITFDYHNSNPLNYAGHLYMDGEEVTELNIPNSVTSIGNYAFYNCSGIKSVTIPNSVTSIGIGAFYNCSGLTSVTIPNSVTSIGNEAFYRCNSLGSVVIGSGVLSIGSAAFSSPAKVIWLTNTPPSGYTAAGGKMNYVANDQYTSLSNKTVYPFLSSMFEVDGIKYVPVSMSERTCDAIDCAYDETARDIHLLPSVSYRGVELAVNDFKPYLFYNNNFVETVSIEAPLQSIYRYTFQGCSSLKGISIPNSVATIEDYVFAGCTSMKTFQIEDRDEEITLGSNGSKPLFADCPLDYVYIGGNITYNPASNKGYSPFYGNTTLREVVITDKETEISANEFYGCTNLQSFTVGDGLISFGDRAFSGCSNLKSLLFGSQVQSIGQETFSDCTSITEITSLAATPPVCGTNALDDINKWECTLHVPEGYKAAYLAADQWKDVLLMNEDSGSGETPHVDPNALVISEAGFATYCPTVDVDFTTLTDVKAYIASGFNRETGVVTMTRVYDVPAGTGLLVKGAAGNYEVPQSPSASIYSNLLRGSTIDRNLVTTSGGYVNYVLGKIGDEVGFCLVPAEGMTLTAGRAYLTMPGETAASRSALNLRFDDEEEATGVSDVERQENGVSTVYDLQGRRVEQPRSGLYIRGGKKVIIK